MILAFYAAVFILTAIGSFAGFFAAMYAVRKKPIAMVELHLILPDSGKEQEDQ